VPFLICLAAEPAAAQMVPRGTGLTSRGGPTAQGEQGLLARVSLFGGYDRNAVAEEPDPTRSRDDARFLTGGGFLGFDAMLGYGKRKGAFYFNGAGWTQQRYFPERQQLVSVDKSAAAAMGLSVPLGSRMALQLDQAALCTSNYGFSVFPTAGGLDPVGIRTSVAETGANFGVLPRNLCAFTSRAGGNWRLGRRSSLSADYRRNYTTFLNESAGLRVQNTELMFEHGVTRYSSLRLGLIHHDSRYEQLPESRTGNTLDAGISYDRPWSISRRTLFRFGFGPAVIDDRGQQRFRFRGNAGLDHAIGRTWFLDVLYRRDVQYIEGIGDLAFSDAVIGSLEGSLSPRTMLRMFATYTGGEIGFAPDAPRYESIAASAEVRRSLNRFMSVYGGYLAYHYRLPNTLRVISGLPLGLDRQGARIGLSLQFPPPTSRSLVRRGSR